MKHFKKINPLVLYALVICFAAAVSFVFSKDDLKSASDSETTSADTYIPAGFVLIPITIANTSALNSLFGKFAIVDIFLPSSSRAKPIKIASSIRLLRAPLNPNQFAVLTEESNAERIIQHDSPLMVVVKNPKFKPKARVPIKKIKKKKTRNRISYLE